MSKVQNFDQPSEAVNLHVWLLSHIIYLKLILNSLNAENKLRGKWKFASQERRKRWEMHRLSFSIKDSSIHERLSFEKQGPVRFDSVPIALKLIPCCECLIRQGYYLSLNLFFIIKWIIRRLSGTAASWSQALNRVAGPVSLRQFLAEGFSNNITRLEWIFVEPPSYGRPNCEVLNLRLRLATSLPVAAQELISQVRRYPVRLWHDWLISSTLDWTSLTFLK